MVRRAVADALPWDESYFLYSEEVDFFRRLRMLGETVWYEPAATMTHVGGGSGAAPELNALLAVNSVRYIRKYHSAAYAAAFHGAVVLSEALRCWKADRKGVLWTVLNEHLWAGLPGPTTGAHVDDFPHGAVIIPAHNESQVIARTLEPLAPLAAAGVIDVFVVCNGCVDDTAEIARGFDGVSVLEIEQASKSAALNAGDAAATVWPRLYLDADIQITPTAVRDVLAALAPGGLLAARPAVRFDLEEAHPLIHAYYGTRLRLPSARSGLWSAGAYGLSERGHERFAEFPNVIADDLFVDRLFSPSEKAVLDVEPVVVRPPRTPGAQLAVLNRVYRGNAQQNSMEKRHGTALGTLKEVAQSIRGPLSAVNAAVYVGFAVAGRRGAAPAGGWERDESSRLPAAARHDSHDGSASGRPITRVPVTGIPATGVPVRGAGPLHSSPPSSAPVG
jgi:hypothetical protein